MASGVNFEHTKNNFKPHPSKQAKLVRSIKKTKQNRPLQVLEIDQSFSHLQHHVKGHNSRVRLRVPSLVCLLGSRKSVSPVKGTLWKPRPEGGGLQAQTSK